MSSVPTIDRLTAPQDAAASPRPREDELDILKAFSIFGVVWIHGAGFLDSSSRTVLVGSIAAFGVPVFVTIWAYLLEKSLSRAVSPWPIVRRRFFALLIPYVFWSGAFIICAGTYRGVSSFTLLNGLLGGYGWAGQYYLLILLQLLPMFPLIRRMVTPRRTVVACLLTLPAFALIGYVLWTFPFVQKVESRLFIYWLPYVAIGVTAARLPRPAIDRILLAFALALILLPAIERSFLRSIGMTSYTYATPGIFLAAMGLMYAIYVGCHGVAAPRALVYVGRNTFGIFVLNPWFVHFATPYFRDRFVVTRIPLVSDVLMPVLSVL